MKEASFVSGAAPWLPGQLCKSFCEVCTIIVVGHSSTACGHQCVVLRGTYCRLEDEEGLVLTPSEKNLEVWRQLWRVLERSDIVVQASQPCVSNTTDAPANL